MALKVAHSLPGRYANLPITSAAKTMAMVGKQQLNDLSGNKIIYRVGKRAFIN